MPPPLVLLGGTFDPPHFGHLLLAECARVQFGAPSVRFMPAGDPYRKAARTVTPAAQRLEMTRLSVSANPLFEVDDREVRRPGPTYTVDTLEELRAEGNTHIILLLGPEALAEVGAWKAPGRIRKLATLVLAPKPERQSAAQLAGLALELQSAALDPARLAPSLKESTRALVRHSAPFPSVPAEMPSVDMPPLAISSTLIRERVAAGQPIRYLTPDPVIEYIASNNLYRDTTPSR